MINFSTIRKKHNTVEKCMIRENWSFVLAPSHTNWIANCLKILQRDMESSGDVLFLLLLDLQSHRTAGRGDLAFLQIDSAVLHKLRCHFGRNRIPMKDQLL